MEELSSFYVIGISYHIKTLREDAHDAQMEFDASRLRVSARVCVASSLFVKRHKSTFRKTAVRKG